MLGLFACRLVHTHTHTHHLCVLHMLCLLQKVYLCVCKRVCFISFYWCEGTENSSLCEYITVRFRKRERENESEVFLLFWLLRISRTRLSTSHGPLLSLFLLSLVCLCFNVPFFQFTLYACFYLDIRALYTIVFSLVQELHNTFPDSNQKLLCCFLPQLPQTPLPKFCFCSLSLSSPSFRPYRFQSHVCFLSNSHPIRSALLLTQFLAVFIAFIFIYLFIYLLILITHNCLLVFRDYLKF